MKARLLIETEDDLKGEVLAARTNEFLPNDVVRNADGHWPDMQGTISHMIGSTNKETWWYVTWGRDKSLDGVFRASALELVARYE